MFCFNSSKPFIISPVLFLIPCTFSVPNRIVLLRSLCRRKLHLSRVFLMGFLAIFFFVDEQETGLLHQPPTWRTRWFLIKVFFSPWYASIELQGSSASFGPHRVLFFPGTRHIWWAFPYPPPGEAPDRRLATPHGTNNNNIIIIII